MNIPYPSPDLQTRLQKLTLLPHSSSSLTSSLSTTSLSPKQHCTFDISSSMSDSYHFNDDSVPTIIDTFAPRPLAFDLSPISSASSDSSSLSSTALSSFEAFVATRSRVVRFYNLPTLGEPFLSAIFLPQSFTLAKVPTPATMWVLRNEYSGSPCDSIWAVYRTHEEASAALSLSGPAMSVTTALESDLEPFHKLRRFALSPSVPSTSSHSSRSSAAALDRPSLRISSSYPNLQDHKSIPDLRPEMNTADYTISSNPPNPRTNFRQGDWICSLPKCAAHNFGRNLVCIGCGCQRSSSAMIANQRQLSNTPIRTLSSPRFASVPSQTLSMPSAQSQQPHYALIPPSQQAQPACGRSPAPLPKSAHPLLTPSGRAFAVGGRVRNISSDPLSPCMMYWPDNEPLPEQGQIRPSGLVGVPQPPILNTGNKGPISHQPGDWICLKCNYLNWRRRKVCQTCLPYAEGNGDSISAAVQAERIALLTSLLAQSQNQPISPPPLPQAPRSHSLTPPQQRRPFLDVSPPQTRAPVHRSTSHLELGTQYASYPIYQTSGHRKPTPLYSAGPDLHKMPVHAPVPLLPSFLLEHGSPALSPTSTSSADLSFEEYDDPVTRPVFLRGGSSDDSVAGSPLANIWKLDGEESRSLSAFALPNHRDLIGSSRKNSQEGLRVHVATS